MSTTWIRVCYGALLGIVLAITVAFGVLIFETGPRPPQPVGVSFASLTGSTTDQENTRIGKQIDSFYSDNQTYREKYPDHQRNIFLWFAGLGLLFGAIGVGLPAIVNYLRLGFVLGGSVLLVAGSWFALQAVPQGAPPASSVLALLSAGTPSQIDSAGRFLRFAVVIVGVLVLLFIGLWRLTDWSGASVVEPASRTPSTAVAPVPGLPGSVSAGYGPVAGGTYPPQAPDTLKWARPGDEPDQVVPAAAAVDGTQLPDGSSPPA